MNESMDFLKDAKQINAQILRAPSFMSGTRSASLYQATHSFWAGMLTMLDVYGHPTPKSVALAYGKTEASKQLAPTTVNCCKISEVP